jgi:hypothetical protein
MQCCEASDGHDIEEDQYSKTNVMRIYFTILIYDDAPSTNLEF